MSRTSFLFYMQKGRNSLKQSAELHMEHTNVTEAVMIVLDFLGLILFPNNTF